MEQRRTNNPRGQQRAEHECASFLTCSCSFRAHYLAEPRARSVLVEHLADHALAHDISIHAWVLMSNHVHFLVSSSRQPIPRWIRDWKRDAVFALRSRCASSLPDEARVGRFWLKGLGYDRDIWSWQEYIEKIRYIELNPVRARIVNRAREYEWSSAQDREVAQRLRRPMLAAPPIWLVDLCE